MVTSASDTAAGDAEALSAECATRAPADRLTAPGMTSAYSRMGSLVVMKVVVPKPKGALGEARPMCLAVKPPVNSITVLAHEDEPICPLLQSNATLVNRYERCAAVRFPTLGRRRRTGAGWRPIALT